MKLGVAILHKVYKMPFSDLYECYVTKVERKERTKRELNTILRWLTRLDSKELAKFVKSKVTLEDFFSKTKLHPNAKMITGSICGVKIEEIQEPLMKKIRYMDKIVDELAKGKSIDKICRTSPQDSSLKA